MTRAEDGRAGNVTSWSRISNVLRWSPWWLLLLLLLWLSLSLSPSLLSQRLPHWLPFRRQLWSIPKSHSTHTTNRLPARVCWFPNIYITLCGLTKHCNEGSLNLASYMQRPKKIEPSFPPHLRIFLIAFKQRHTEVPFSETLTVSMWQRSLPIQPPNRLSH